MEAFNRLIQAFNDAHVRAVLIGVAGANYYAPTRSAAVHTDDRDLYLPPDPSNLVAAWKVCEELRLELACSGETLDIPRDLWLAERMVAVRALTRVSDGAFLHVDLTLVMAGFEFETVWRERRPLVDDDVEIPVARLMHIVTSKALAARPKDHLFIATHSAALSEMVARDERLPPRGSG